MIEPYYDHAGITIYRGDCREILPTLDACSVDAVVTDPPYDLTNRVPDVKKCRACDRVLGGRDGHPERCPRCGGELYNQRSQATTTARGFMGKSWDGTGIAFRPETWAEVYRVLKPGGYLLAAGGTRTHHRMMVAVEDAGFEIRDTMLYWGFGSGFPKSHNLDGEWKGWGTALKPAFEPIVMARKPLAEATVAANVARYGTGAINIDGCRIGLQDGEANPSIARYQSTPQQGNHGWTHVNRGANFNEQTAQSMASGRWPANLLLDEAAAAELDAMSGERRSAGNYPTTYNNSDGGYGEWAGRGVQGPLYADTGGASRFFYVAKASRAEREQGLENYTRRNVNDGRQTSIDNPYQRGDTLRANTHPTVKPIALMRYLVRLVTPPDGLVLDPFMGSGSTGVACMDERFRFIGIEMEEEYLAIARSRIEAAAASPVQEVFSFEVPA